MGISLRICEIYTTIMGESSATGWPCTLVRTGGCNLRCTYCDTRYAYTEFSTLSLGDILGRIRPCPLHVLITGGEPLLQEGTPALIKTLLERGHKVFIETNGSIDVSIIDRRAVKVMDIKCPSSGESARNLLDNFAYLAPHDEVKFVICNREDFMWAKEIIERFGLPSLATVFLSPCHRQIEARELAQWILEERLEARLQIQLHKLLWGEKRGV